MTSIKKCIVRILKQVFALLSYILPKKKKQIFFRSKPDYSGNCKALSDYITKCHPEYTQIWSLSHVRTLPNGYKVVKHGTLTSLCFFLRSQYIVTTHNEMIGIKSTNQKYISLWHGMPLKKICYLGEFDHYGMEDYSALRIATSEVMRSIISACFREKANNVYVTGQPRNDYLFESDKFNLLNYDIPDDKKIIAYMPTFRENFEDKNFSDGNCIDHDNFLRVRDFNLEALDEFLSANNIILLLKLHPYEEISLQNSNIKSNNIKIVNSEELADKHLDVNHVLACAHCLITDYSSAYFDYLILKKPIIFLTPDVDKYSISRGGFTLEPFNEWTPGRKIDSQKELLEEISNLLINNSDEYIEHRDRINSIINRYTDSNNSKRVYEKFFGV